MSALTIDQLKKSLTEQGVPLPPSGSKKAEYVKLYEQHTLNEGLGDTFSDDEANGRTDSQNVSSSSSPSKLESVAKEIERLSNDELFIKLKEFGENVGPVLVNTRRVYEKKLLKLLSANQQSNGLDSVNSHNSKFDEFSDNEDIPLPKESARRSEPKEMPKGKRSSVLRDSPKRSLNDSTDGKSQNQTSFESIHESEISTKKYTSINTPSRVSYIETIPKGSSKRIIEPADGKFFSSTLRSRYTLDPSYKYDDSYVGKWEPDVGRYVGKSQQTKSKQKNEMSNWGRSILGGLGLAVLLLGAIYIYYQWSATDPYSLIDEEVKQVSSQVEENKSR